MKIYLNTLDKRVINVDIEKSFPNYKEIEAQNSEDFFDIITKDYTIEDDLIEQIIDLVDNNAEITSLESFNIKHWVSNRSFGELIDMYDSGEIIKPDMQREFVWDAQKCSRLIESIILGLPIPPLFLLEVESNKYELIDGFQRLNTLVNFVKGVPWNGSTDSKRQVSSKLSGKVSREIRGLSFDKLLSEHQRIIKRSTIPLIEFRQLGPNNLSSKYLIFERINTGSEKLNQMQIRKSLAYGKFMSKLYLDGNNCLPLRELFSTYALKKDQHIEAYLRTIALSRIYYDNFPVNKTGMNNILNDFCEVNRNRDIGDEYIRQFTLALNGVMTVFIDSKNAFRRIEKSENDDFIYSGNMNISILESILGVMIHYNFSITQENRGEIEGNYKRIMYLIFDEGRNKKSENPFSTSTGTERTIRARFDVCERILGIK
ncbi:MAG: hypothetical protein A2Y20_05160 [Firmicutes bacterium GWF2_51_9]|nr:MAG: hypothetical protein A2Y20_05160 [Firmicutes bacterium GWF2_51_9]OGS57595.1 MAG: hypothetical protein A2Y19_05235 [Firmicutes bacterium GWE2_51_13]